MGRHSCSCAVIWLMAALLLCLLLLSPLQTLSSVAGFQKAQPLVYSTREAAEAAAASTGICTGARPNVGGRWLVGTSPGACINTYPTPNENAFYKGGSYTLGPDREWIYECNTNPESEFCDLARGYDRNKYRYKVSKTGAALAGAPSFYPWEVDGTRWAVDAAMPMKKGGGADSSEYLRDRYDNYPSYPAHVGVNHPSTKVDTIDYVNADREPYDFDPNDPQSKVSVAQQYRDNPAGNYIEPAAPNYPASHGYTNDNYDESLKLRDDANYTS